MKRPFLDSRLYWASYPAWVLACGIAFFMLRGQEAPHERGERIELNRAYEIALGTLQEIDRQKFAQYEVVHTAYSRAGEAGREQRMLVLCDEKERSGLREAYLVELAATSGEVLEVRKMDADDAAIGEPLKVPTR